MTTDDRPIPPAARRPGAPPLPARAPPAATCACCSSRCRWRCSTSPGCCSPTASATRCCTRCCSPPSCSTSCRRSASGGPARASAARAPRRAAATAPPPAVDVFIPVYNEPVDGRRADGRAPRRGCAAPRVRVAAARRRRPATRWRAHGRARRRRLRRRADHHGAKAGNINHALARTDAPFVVVLDCDHVPDAATSSRRRSADFADDARRLRADAAVLRQRRRERARRRRVEPAGAVLRPDRPRQGRPRRDVLLRHQRRLPPRTRSRTSAASRETSLTEDFELSIAPARARLALASTCPRCSPAASAPRTWPPTSASSTAGRAAACRRIPRVLRARAAAAPASVQYLLSASYFLTGWTVLVYMALPGRAHPHRRPAARRRRRPTSSSSHFAPVLRAVAARASPLLGGGRLHVHAPSRCRRRASGSTSTPRWPSCCGRRGSFVVTPKAGADGRAAARGRARRWP